MKGVKFTAEELAEMAAADAEIEATFELTPQEAYDADRRDRQIQRSNLPPEKALQVEKERRYRRENREKIRARSAEYRKKNADHRRAIQRAYYQANKDRISAWKKEWYQRRKQANSTK